jgi:hypothetical protein
MKENSFFEKKEKEKLYIFIFFYFNGTARLFSRLRFSRVLTSN